jgi:hypothetical protein
MKILVIGSPVIALISALFRYRGELSRLSRATTAQLFFLVFRQKLQLGPILTILCIYLFGIIFRLVSPFFALGLPLVASFFLGILFFIDVMIYVISKYEIKEAIENIKYLGLSNR